MPEVLFHNIGLREYKETWDYQEELFNQVQMGKQNNQSKINNHLIFCEHPHVYTLGRSGDEGNLLLNFLQLQAKKASFYHTNRGGDITYHGPGQLVGYPIFDLTQFGIGIKDYIFILEEAIILALAEYAISGTRYEGATGVWLDVGTPKARKICAIGVRTSHWVTMHGFALNINTDLDYFRNINPCGFVDKSVTSIHQELGREIDFKETSIIVLKQLKQVFNFEIKTE